eukprot:scaffold1938_cov260-Amphora_coffeaeformis.AAC.1
MIYSPRAFTLLAAEILGVDSFNDRMFRSHFGCSPDICSILWQQITRGCNGMPYHLLWALNFLKSYDTEDVMACRFHVTRNTLRKWIWIYVRKICRLKRKVIRWQNRKKYGGMNNRWCMVSVDGTDFEI